MEILVIEISSNSLTIANAFNSYFSSVAENLLSKNYINKTNTNKDFFILLTTILLIRSRI
jgi:hypothetical protein